MKELWEQALHPYTLPLTVILGLVAIYWILSVIGTVDLDSFDVDLDADVEGDVSASGNFMGFILRFVNAQDVPVMIVLSLLTLFLWMGSIASNFYLNPGDSVLVASGLFLANFVVSVLMVKAVTQPLRPFLRALKNDQEHQEPLIGMAGVVKSRVLDADYGQVTVARHNGAPALLNCRLATGDSPLVRGDEVLVIGRDEQKDRFIVKSTQNLAVNQMPSHDGISDTISETDNSTKQEL